MWTASISPDYSELRDFEQLQIFNNGTVELKIDFEIREQNSKSQQLKTERYLIIFDFEAELRKLIQGTSQMYQKLGRSTDDVCLCNDCWLQRPMELYRQCIWSKCTNESGPQSNRVYCQSKFGTFKMISK